MLGCYEDIRTKINVECGYHAKIWRGLVNEELNLHMSKIIAVTAFSFKQCWFKLTTDPHGTKSSLEINGYLSESCRVSRGERLGKECDYVGVF